VNYLQASLHQSYHRWTPAATITS